MYRTYKNLKRESRRAIYTTPVRTIIRSTLLGDSVKKDRDKRIQKVIEEIVWFFVSLGVLGSILYFMFFKL